MGIPVIGCKCPVCQSEISFNKRLRPSALLMIDGKRILIDCGPDFREQALRYGLDQLDGIIITHAHNDHTAGFDELRIYSLRTHQAIPCLLSPDTLADLKRRFYYIFDEDSPYAALTAKFQLQLLESERAEVLFAGLDVRYFTYQQGGMNVNGFRFGNLAYVSDIRDYPTTIFEDLKGVETLVISALRFSSTPLHFSIDEAVDFSRRVGAKQTWLMHIAHELDHEKANAYLPADIRLAYDGLEI
ncbi:MAG: MBL fold metallo-hydrolase [Parachlamydiaceae bacterium]|nr:MBL fold metallo-hydrolase [Parachlamydiaceae bacterium]